MNNVKFVVAGIFSLGVSAALLGCSATSQPDDSTSSAGSGGAGGSNVTTTTAIGVGSGGGTTAKLGCSDDLQSVVDEAGTIVQACPPDQGCFEGSCIPACEAAAKSQGSIGCEYMTMTPPFINNANVGVSPLDGPCYAVFVANAWGRHAKLSLSYGGQSYDVAQFARVPSGVGAAAQYNPLPAQGLPPGEVAVLFLSHRPGVYHPIGSSLECPAPPAVLLDTAIHNSGRGTAFAISSDTPITSYDILPYGGAQSYLPSASLLYPRTAWGSNYLAVAPHGGNNSGKLWLGLVGQTDNTNVTLNSPVALPGGGNAPAVTANTPATFTINAGEVIQWHGADPTAAVLQSDNPVAVFTGSDYLRVPTANSLSGGGQDSAHQQIPHVSALGHEYVGGGVVTRRADLALEDMHYRLVGAVDGTQLTWDPGPPMGAPTQLNRGDVVEFSTTSFFFVAAQDDGFPFSLTQYLGGTWSNTRPGCGTAFPSCGLGDEEWVMMTPPGQFLRRYVFFVDPTYATTNLVLVRQRNDTGFSDVDISCLGKVSGWQAVGAGGNYEVAHVDLFRAFKGSNINCETSQHVATSDGDFGITVWGTDSYASYGYPAGGNLATINTVVIKPEPPK